jgi:hypothetical protein
MLQIALAGKQTTRRSISAQLCKLFPIVESGKENLRPLTMRSATTFAKIKIQIQLQNIKIVSGGKWKWKSSWEPFFPFCSEKNV